MPDKLQIGRIVDPFGRAAVLTYFPDGSLKSIQDVIGMTSSFSYDAPYGCSLIGQVQVVGYYGEIGFSSSGSGGGSAVEGRGPIFIPNVPSTPLSTESGGIGSMTTPYGRTTFVYGRDDSTNSRCLEIIDPEGRTERVEFRHQAPGVGASEAQIPTGIGDLTIANQYLDYRNSFYWDPYAITQMRSANPGNLGLDFAKARITHWLHKDADTTSGIVESRKNPLESRVWYTYPGQTQSAFAGRSALPSAIARVLSDGATRKISLDYNDRMQVRRIVDPTGIITEVTYDANGLDILSIGRKATEADTLVELRGFAYDRNRRVTQVRTAGGNSYEYTYLGDNVRPATRTDKAGRIDSYTYNPLNQLSQIDILGTTLWKHFDYDLPGRLSKLTSSDGYELNYGYDDMDRLTSVKFPDQTQQTYVYDKLDLHEVHSRAGVVGTYSHDGARRLRKVVDPSNLVVLDYYPNNALKSTTVDGNKTTRWDIDLQGRPVSKTYADGTQDHFAFDDHVSALNEKINSAGYKTSLKYRADGRLVQLLQTNRGVPDDVTVLTYDDPYFLRPTSIKKGPVGGGAGTLVTFEFYPPLTASGEPQLEAHRLRQERVDGVPTGPTYTYDATGRLSTSRLGTTTTFVYDDIGRIKTYHGLRDFELVYEPESGRLKSIDSDLIGTSFTYKDSVGDMRLDTLNNRSGRSYGYTYDVAGNIQRIRETRSDDSNDAQWKYDYDDANRLTQGAKLPGVSTFAYDGSGNLSTLRGETFTYNSLNQITTQPDSALPQEQQRRYIYDSSNRLVEIIYTGNSGKHTRLSYDPLGRISTISDVTQLFGQAAWNVTELVWCGLTVCQEKTTLAGAGGFEGRGLTSTRVYFPEGYRDSRAGTVLFRRDHLGSVRETISDSGATLGSYDYDPYGQSLTGKVPPIGFAGMYFHVPSGLYLTPFRAYDPRLGRWLTRDPIAERGGLNLYAYVDGNPVSRVDRSGLFAWTLATPVAVLLDAGGAAAASAAALVVGAGVAGVAVGTLIDQTLIKPLWIPSPSQSPIPIAEPSPKNNPHARDLAPRTHPELRDCELYREFVQLRCNQSSQPTDAGCSPTPMHCLDLSLVCEDSCLEGGELSDACPDYPFNYPLRRPYPPKWLW